MDVVVVGSCMMDLISYTERLPKPGETIRGNKFQIGFGGKGANQCVMAAKLGAKTAMVAKLGKDSYGNNSLANLNAVGINTDHVHQTHEASSGIASIIVSDDGQNSIVIVAGANMLLFKTDVDKAAKLIGTAKVLVCQLEIHPSTSLAALQMARKKGVFSIFNPAPALPDLDPGFFSACDLLCANETEAELLTGLKVYDTPSAKIAAQELLKKGCDAVIITLGNKGCIFTTSQNNGLHIPVKPVTAVDTTGAGDAFIGALAFFKAVIPSLPLEVCVQRANEVAAMSCLQPGTQTSFPTADQLEPRLLETL